MRGLLGVVGWVGGWVVGWVAGWVLGCVVVWVDGGVGSVEGVWVDGEGSLREGEGDGVFQVYRVGPLAAVPGVLRVISVGDECGVFLPVCWDVV